jgi:hypothetical protein
MVTTPLGALLEELGNTALISIAALKANNQNTCLIPFPDGLRLQIELDKHEKNLLICCVLGDLEPGEYRKKIFCEALKTNGMTPPLYGILAFSTKTNKLVLFDLLDMRELTGNRIADYLPSFLEKARIWRDALAGNNIPSISPSRGTSGKMSGLFGLKL